MNRYLSENNIVKLIVFLPILAIIFTSTILTNYYIDNLQDNYQTEVELIQINHIKQQKESIRKRVLDIEHILQTKQEDTINTAKENIKSMISIGHALMLSTYERYQHLPKEEILNHIKTQLRDVRFYNDKSGYFFILDLKGNNILSPMNKSFEGKSLLLVQDPTGKYIIKDIIANLQKKDETFDTWYWYKKGETTFSKKLGFYKVFRPLNLIIGTGKYYDDIQIEDKSKLLDLLHKINKQRTYHYVFAIDHMSKTIAHANKNFLNKTKSQLNPTEQKIITNIMKEAKKKEGSFIEYFPTTQLKENFPSKKVSFVKYIPDLQWTIGTGIYNIDLIERLEVKKHQLENTLAHTKQNILITSAFITIFLILIMLLIAKTLQNILNSYATRIESKNNALKEINATLKDRIAEEVIKNREQDKLMFHQSKMAAMGEMLGNIAHQWRQPLSAISTIASGIRLQNELKTLDTKVMNKELETIVNNTQHLSTTIDDFRNFFHKNKQTNTFYVQDCINKALSLIEANLHDKHIEIEQSIENYLITTYENELIQALLNIINNAKDVLNQRHEYQQKIIRIKTYRKTDNYVIEILDSGGGISEDIIDKIFDPYFTTKFKAQGTGIGLYMTQRIIVSNLKGHIKVKNTTFTHEDDTFTGAQFEIILPSKLKS